MKTLMEKQLLKIIRSAPKETGFWTGTKELLDHAGSGGVMGALTALLEEEASLSPADGYSGFILEMAGGSAIVIMAHTSCTIELTLRTQGHANAVLFTLMGNKFITQDRIPTGTYQRSAWGDVTQIRWFRASNRPAAQVVQFDTLWPANAT